MKMKQKWNKNEAKNGPKMATVNNPSDCKKKKYDLLPRTNNLDGQGALHLVPSMGQPRVSAQPPAPAPVKPGTRVWG